MKDDSSNNIKVKEKGKKKWNEGVDAGKVSRSQSETSKNGATQNQKFKKKVEMKEVQCYCFQKFGHHAPNCCCNKESNGGDKFVIQFAHTGCSDSKEVILMDTTHLTQEKENVC